MSTTEKRLKVVKSHPSLSLAQQCEALDIHRSGLYFKPKGESALNLRLMELIVHTSVKVTHLLRSKVTRVIEVPLSA